MKEVIVHSALPVVTTSVHDIPIPEPKDDEILIKVIVAGSNQKGMPGWLLEYEHFNNSSSRLQAFVCQENVSEQRR